MVWHLALEDEIPQNDENHSNMIIFSLCTVIPTSIIMFNMYVPLFHSLSRPSWTTIL